jgi:hypothetical protein
MLGLALIADSFQIELKSKAGVIDGQFEKRKAKLRARGAGPGQQGQE